MWTARTNQKKSICYAIIEPNGLEMAECAKKIRIEFLKIFEDITRKINIDEFVRALPAGKSQIREISLGDLEKENSTDNELE